MIKKTTIVLDEENGTFTLEMSDSVRFNEPLRNEIRESFWRLIRIISRNTNLKKEEIIND